MNYLTEATEIQALITKLTSHKTLWLDTEVADWNTPKPRLSLIQVFTNYAYILDVLDKPDLVTDFVAKIMANPKIEKVFHNASFDLKYLGKELAQNVTCTYKLAKKIGRSRLGTSNLKLKTLARELCQFSDVDTEEQRSDWGQRPLSEKQIKYAKMDTIYLAQVHQRLLSFTAPVKPIHPSFSVTKVRVAYSCPRLFYLNQHFGGKTLFLPSDNVKGIGSDFHKLAEEFTSIAKREPQFQTLFKPPVEQLNVEAIASQMQQLFYELSFYPYLQATIQKNPTQATALHQIWQGLTQLIGHWAKLLIKNRRYCTADVVIERTFIAGELPLEHNFTLPNGTQQRLAGKLDSLVFDFEKQRLCVVEYKTYEPVDSSAQLAQVALYSYMLREKKQVPVDSAVYCVFPQFKAYYYPWEQLEETVHQLTPHKLQQMQQWLTWEAPQSDPPPPTSQPHLCEICPQQEKCQSFFEQGSMGEMGRGGDKGDEETRETRERGSRGDEETREREETRETRESPEADSIAQQLVTTLQSYNIDVEYQGATVGTAFIRVKLKPNLGVKVSSLLRLSADLQVQLGIAHPPMIAPQPGYVSVDLPRPDRQIARFEDYIQPQKLPVDAPVKIALGVDLDGQLVETNLSDPSTCHFLVGGTPGSGKSEFLRSLLLSLLYRHSPDQLKIALVDPKRVTFPEFEKMPWLRSPVVKDSEAAIALMEELVAEMSRRYQLLEIARCPHLTAYNQQQVQRQQPPVPRLVCIFDEYADFMVEKESRSALEQSIKRLGAMARAAGIHLIIATQRPDASVVTPIIRSNLPGRVALRTASEADSAIILGGKQTEAANLLGKGDLLYLVGAQLQRLQSLFAAKIQLPD